MDYIPVYEGEDAEEGGSVKISTAKVQKLGVRTEAAALRDLSRPVRAAGRVERAERAERGEADSPSREPHLPRRRCTSGSSMNRNG